MRCKPKVMIRTSWVLRFCIRPLNGTFVFLAIMDIRTRSISFVSRPQRLYDASIANVLFVFDLHCCTITAAVASSYVGAIVESAWCGKFSGAAA